MKLKGKIALVTGSSTGIGKAVAELYAREGANVIVCSSTTVQEGENVAKELVNIGTDSIYIQADLTKESDVKMLFEKIKNKYGKLDILVNNAGKAYGREFKNITQDIINSDIDLNFTSAVLCSKYAVELMKDEGWIINTSSIRGTDYSDRPGIMMFCAGKAAMNSFTKNLALELSPKIFVNAVAPGFVHTRYMDSVTEEIKENWLKDIPIKKFIMPEEIAEVYLMLATSKIFTGSIITPDGGYSILNR